MEKTTNILIADLEDPSHMSAIIDLVNDYSRDEMGNRDDLPSDVLERLPEGLRNHPTTLVFLAFEDNYPIGVAVCFIGFSTFAAKPLINIHDLAVRKGFRDRGIGRKLLRAVEEKARDMDCCKLTLEVREDNERGLYLYRDFGFDEGEARMYFWAKFLH